MAKSRPMGDILREAIRQGGWSAAALAEKTGVPRGQISSFLRGRDLQLSKASALADFLGLELTRKRKLPKAPPEPTVSGKRSRQKGSRQGRSR
jgi:transcriptional regulator with XRE-family HTH domain